MNDTDALANRLADFDREERRIQREAERRGVAPSAAGNLLERRAAFRDLQDEARHLGFRGIDEFRARDAEAAELVKSIQAHMNAV